MKITNCIENIYIHVITFQKCSDFNIYILLVKYIFPKKYIKKSLIILKKKIVGIYIYIYIYFV